MLDFLKRYEFSKILRLSDASLTKVSTAAYYELYTYQGWIYHYRDTLLQRIIPRKAFSQSLEFYLTHNNNLVQETKTFTHFVYKSDTNLVLRVVVPTMSVLIATAIHLFNKLPRKAFS